MNRLRFVAKSLVHGAIDWSGRPRRQRQRLRGKLIILTYHSFCTAWPRGLFNSLPIHRFERQIRFLRNNFKLVSLQQGLGYLKQGLVDDQPWVAITIDDGFRDSYTHAWPVLQRYGVPATIFLATDFIDNGRPPWTTQLVEILDRTEAHVMEWPFRADLKNLVARSCIAQQLKNDWSSLPPVERFEKLTEFRRNLHVDEEVHYSSLAWRQINEMRADGVTFGSHTVYHSILPAVNSTVLVKELRESRNRLESELQEPCVLFAYPDGKHNRLSKEALESCGYQVAVTQDFGFNQHAEERLELKRIEIPYHDPLPSFRGRVSFALTRSEFH